MAVSTGGIRGEGEGHCEGDNVHILRFTSPLLLSEQQQQQSSSSSSSSRSKTAMIILNTPISKPPSLVFDRLWKLSSNVKNGDSTPDSNSNSNSGSACRICADGGANRLYDATHDLVNCEDYIPNRIRGDLDSLRDDVREYYASKGVSIEQDPDQDTNDLDKALQVLIILDDGHNKEDQDQDQDYFDNICIYGAFGGRFDQEMASFQALYKWGTPKPPPPSSSSSSSSQEEGRHRLWLYSDQTCAVLIPGNNNNNSNNNNSQITKVELELPYYGEEDNMPISSVVVGEGPTCGLIPLGSACESMVTTGLKWDLDGSSRSEFGGLVSTSNRIMEPIVTIQASHPIIFTAEILIHGENNF